MGTIAVQPVDPARMKEAEAQIQALLRQRHRLQPGEDDDFTLRNAEEAFVAQEASA